MELVRGVHNLAARHQGGIVAIGSFDGLHLGHRALIDATVAQARRSGMSQGPCPAVMLTFEPLPREFLTPAEPPARLTNLRERVRLLAGSGLDALMLLRFDARLRGMDGDAFVRLLTERLQARGVVVGHDFFVQCSPKLPGVLSALIHTSKLCTTVFEVVPSLVRNKPSSLSLARYW